MVPARSRSRPPPPLLLACLLGLQWASAVTAQTTSGPPPQSASWGTGSTWGLQEEDLATGGLRLTTSERKLLCEAPTLQRPPPEDPADGSSRTRRSSEWSPERQLADSGAPAPGPDGCPTYWDGVLCWPTTSAGRNHSLPCFHELRGVLYDTSGRASRTCRSDGVWASPADYSACSPLLYPQQPASGAGTEAQTFIYLTGYAASLVALVAATAIFRHFKELRCPRNIIHTNLFVACMVNGALWITVMTIELTIAETTPTSCGLVILLHYFHVATFFWMFVEGLNLYMMVVQTFTVDRVRLVLYPLIGWGLPLVAVTAWSIVRTFTANDVTSAEVELSLHQLHAADQGNFSFVRGLELPLEQTFFEHCPWLEASEWDWIHLGPSLLVLACNVVFLARIMCVLITKLRSTNSAETQQYKKATKALLVLLPLLGVTYILVLVSPSTTHVISYIQSILVSTQGLVISLLYCFCNAEVQLTLRKHWRRWRGKAYQSPADVHRTRPEAVASRLRAAGDTSATDLTYMTAMESDNV